MDQLTQKIIRALAKVANRDQNVRESGNVKSLIMEIGLEKCEEIADMSFDTPIATNEIREVVMKAILLGRLAKAKLIARVVFPNKHLYFIGSEADVVRKLRPLLPEEETEENKKYEEKEDKTKESESK